MITVNNLTKSYKTKEDEFVIALDNVSFKLPDKGMVFICGKSGSGKSTLLNILACLDDFDEGEVIVDGNNLKDLDQSLYDAYRSSLIGFVFQDFNLINNLTIKENIEVSLDLINDDNKEIVPYMLSQVGLDGYENRFPKELSGGQKQRVAIARCLVKNPKYIFADEPTGNLDHATSIQILDLLKELSEDRLILIVSHNLTDAYQYADRIIEMADGKIVKDIERDTFNTDLVDGNVIYLPHDKILTDDELQVINDKIKTGNFEISQQNRKFKPSVVEIEESYYELDKNDKFNFKSIHKFSKTFNKGYTVQLVFNAIVITCLFVALLVAEMFFNFDSHKFINEELSEDISFTLYKNEKSKQYLSPVTNEDIQWFYDQGYQGNVYRLYSYNIPTVYIDGTSQDAHVLEFNRSLNYDLVETPAIQAGKGILECDLEFLIKKYGVDNKLNLVAGTLDPTTNGSIIITDYFADCIQYYRNMEYDKIVSQNSIWNDFSEYRVKAIIDTGYKTRYQHLIEEFQKYLEIEDKEEKKLKEEELKASTEYIDFYEELNTYLAVGYFVDGNFYDTLKTNSDMGTRLWTINPKFYDSNDAQIDSKFEHYAYTLDNTVKPGHVILGIETLKSIYGITDLEGFEIPSEITISDNFFIRGNDDESFIERTFIVQQVLYHEHKEIRLQPTDYWDYYSVSCMTYGLYFDNPNSIRNIYNTSKDFAYYTNNEYFNALQDINQIILIFKGIFRILNIFIYFVIIFLLVTFSRTIIKRKIYEIGIIRCLGAKTKDIFVVILRQILLMMLMVTAVSVVTIVFLDDAINTMLLQSLLDYKKINVLADITIISLKPRIIIYNLLFFFVLILVNSLAIVMLLRKIKPINIIKKEE